MDCHMWHLVVKFSITDPAQCLANLKMFASAQPYITDQELVFVILLLLP